MSKIIFYHTETCPQCKMVEMLLKKKNINYDSCLDIDEMINKGINHTPAIDLDGDILVGKSLMT